VPFLLVYGGKGPFLYGWMRRLPADEGSCIWRGDGCLESSMLGLFVKSISFRARSHLGNSGLKVLDNTYYFPSKSIHFTYENNLP
jgi:hypothetical protein